VINRLVPTNERGTQVTTATFTRESTSRFVDVAEMSIHYNDVDVAGTGKTLVMIHGGGPGASSWTSFKQNVPAYAGDYRVLLLDLPGYGRSRNVVIEGGMFTFYASVVRGFLDALGIERATFLGNSLGGGVSFKTALENPDRVERLALIAPAGASVPIFSPPGLPPEDIKLTMELYADPSHDTMAAFLRKMTLAQDVITPDVVEERLEILEFQGDDRAKLLSLIERGAREGKNPLTPDHMEELWRDAERVAQPTLLMWGRDDKVVPLDAALHLLKHMPDVQLHVFANCGHWAHRERQREFDAVVRAFLGSETY
jgi:4,5:9,10-diseco-3-hydroxy-5,9,17-trioxoandrosta-1(10),2-diene-4-oate hydrolase